MASHYVEKLPAKFHYILCFYSRLQILIDTLIVLDKCTKNQQSPDRKKFLLDAQQKAHI